MKRTWFLGGLAALALAAASAAAPAADELVLFDGSNLDDGGFCA